MSYKSIISLALVLLLNGCEVNIDDSDPTATTTLIATEDEKELNIDSSETTTEDEKIDSLTIINDTRAEFFDNPMSWSDEIELSAQEYANYLAQNGLFVHGNSGYGENLYMSSGSATYQNAINSWNTEANDYNHQTKSCNIGKVCGHYTQIIWEDTREVGCGKAIVQTGEWTGGTVVVCRFNPLGNYSGVSPY